MISVKNCANLLSTRSFLRMEAVIKKETKVRLATYKYSLLMVRNRNATAKGMA